MFYKHSYKTWPLRGSVMFAFMFLNKIKHKHMYKSLHTLYMYKHVYI
jgi:hypothetical protein